MSKTIHLELDRAEGSLQRIIGLIERRRTRLCLASQAIKSRPRLASGEHSCRHHALQFGHTRIGNQGRVDHSHR